MKRKSSDLTEFYIQFLIVVYLLWSFPVLSFGQKEVLVPADGTVSEGEEQPVVALTFDDGPSGTSTPVLLEGLRKRGVRATFFVVGEDWMTEDVSRITQSVLEKVEPGDIILLHDSYLSSVQAALRIVDALQGKGYEFITVDQMISD